MDTAAPAGLTLGAYELYATFLILGGIASVIYVAKKWKTWIPLRRPIGGWHLPAVDAALFAWGIICCALFAGYLGQRLTRSIIGSDEVIEDNLGLFIICSGAIMQGGFILLFATWENARRPFSEGPVSTRSLSAYQLIGYSVVLLLAAFPLINILAWAWTALLEGLVDLGVPLSVEKQETIFIFAENRDNPAIFLGMLFVAAILAPIGEELVFRAGIFRYMLSKVGLLPAALISSALFGALHFSLFGIVPLSLLGITLCYAYYLTGNIRVPIIMHMIFNANTILVLWLFPEVANAL